MATLIRTNGIEQRVTYAGLDGFKFHELYQILACETVETLTLRDGRTMVLDENGKATNKPVNATATRLAREAGIAPEDFVVGDVLVCVTDGGGNLR